MRRKGIIAVLALLWAASGCQTSQFTSWQTEEFNTVPITESVTRTITFRNQNNLEEQKLLGIGFDGSGDGRMHFRIDKVMVGSRAVGQKEIIVPPGSSLNFQVTYQPRNLDTTKADFGGWVTGEEKRFVPYKPGEKDPNVQPPKAIHRALLMAVYEHPKSGIAQIELIGTAVEGPNGEIALPDIGAGECETGGGTACFSGNFSIDIPQLFKTGPIEEPLVGPIRLSVSGSNMTLRMEDMPPVVLVLRGNGPGEPLQGQPVSAVSIIIRGVRGEEAAGTFDGSRLDLQNLSFRIQVVVGEITPKDVAGVSPIVDFQLGGLTLTTEEPFTDGNITLLIDTTLSEKPSGNALFDDFLGNTQILVRFRGLLEM